MEKYKLNRKDIEFENSSIIILVKDREIEGSIMTPIELVGIGITGLKKVQDVLSNSKNWNEIIDNFILELNKLKK